MVLLYQIEQKEIFVQFGVEKNHLFLRWFYFLYHIFRSEDFFLALFKSVGELGIVNMGYGIIGKF